MSFDGPIIDPADYDWSQFGDHIIANTGGLTALEHVKQTCLGQAIANGTLRKAHADAFLITFGRKDILTNAKRNKVIDASQAVSACEDLARAEAALGAAKALRESAEVECQRATAARDRARTARREAIRAVYRGGATAHALSDAIGLSVARVNQLVVGARS